MSHKSQALSVAVLIPTFRRPADLERCLRALAAQSVKASQILVVVRPEDDESGQVLQRLEQTVTVSAVTVHEPGQVAALNEGLARVTSDIVAITDDDTAPHPDWISKIRERFSFDSRLSGLGGRDIVYHNDTMAPGAELNVGILQWFGRNIGNHHLGIGPIRKVDFIKGANMSYRLTHLNGLLFDRRLLGRGAQVCNDMAFSLALQRRGGVVMYDPEVRVDHFPGMRFDTDQRAGLSLEAKKNHAANETIAILSATSPIQRICFVVWSLLIGHRALPGIAQAVRLKLKGERHSLVTLRSTALGRLKGMWLWATA